MSALAAAQSWARAVRAGDADQAWLLVAPEYRERLARRHAGRYGTILGPDFDERVERFARADDAGADSLAFREEVRASAIERLAGADDWPWSTDPGPAGPDVELVSLVGPWARDHMGDVRPCVVFQMRLVDGVWLVAGFGEDLRGG